MGSSLLGETRKQTDQFGRAMGALMGVSALHAGSEAEGLATSARRNPRSPCGSVLCQVVSEVKERTSQARGTARAKTW